MIRVEHIAKSFKLYRSPALRLKEIVLRRAFHKRFEALHDISFVVGEGETLGIVGQNGAGKSTLLKILTGVMLPDAGRIELSGKITGLLELGTGFQPDFTGMQNIYFNAALLGMGKEEVSERLAQIIAFSELDEFIREPIKTYSSGMVMRLAFSVAIHANPRAFVVDEALSVGDAYFQQKCMRKIREFREQGGSIVFVSHDMNAVKVLCDRALLLDHGRTVDEGEPDKVINTYNFLLARKSKGEEIRIQDSRAGQSSYGNFKVTIEGVRVLNAGGQDTEVFVAGEKCIIEITLHSKEDVSGITVGILIRDKFGQDIFGTNTYHLKVPLDLKAGETCMARYVIDELNIGAGKYTLTAAAHSEDTHVGECYQWVDQIKSFEVVGSKDVAFIGIARLKPCVVLERI